MRCKKRQIMETQTQKTDYLDILKTFSRTYDFLEKQRIQEIERLDSLWRKENLLLRIGCSEQDYVFKMINGKEKISELNRVKLMKDNYPDLMPEVFVFEDNAYLMDYIDGNSFFNLKNSEKTEKLNLAGRILSNVYLKYKFKERDISKEVYDSFNRYWEKRNKFFLDDELRLKEETFEIFKRVPNQPSHNDLNATNLIYGKEIKLIDPSEEGFNDISRDIGRYCASCFFNNYDYFGNDKKHSLEIAEIFLSNFDEEILERAKYFIGESFLSFLNFDTVSVSKNVLKHLAMNLLLKKGKIIYLLEDSLK